MMYDILGLCSGAAGFLSHKPSALKETAGPLQGSHILDNATAAIDRLIWRLT